MRLSASLSLPLTLPLALLLGSFAAGCDDGHGHATAVTIETVDPPALVAFRPEGRTEWQSLAVAGKASFGFEVTGPYELVIVCDDLAGFVDVEHFARTPEDAASIEYTCESLATPFAVRGTMVQPGELAFDSSSTESASPNWSFQLSTSDGAHDLIMRSADGRIGMRRAIQITADRQLGTIDLAQETLAAMVPTAFTATNLRPTESRSSASYLETEGSFLFLHIGSGWDMDIAPQSVLEPTDHQSIGITAGEPTGGPNAQRKSRSIRRDVRVGDPTAVTLPEPLGPVTFEAAADRLAATWSTLPEHDGLRLTHYSYSDDLVQTWYYSTFATRAFVDATGARSIALDFRDVPGFKSEWRHDPAHEQSRQLSAVRDLSPSETATSTVSESIEPVTARPAPAATAAAAGDSAALRRLALRGAL